MHRCSRIVLPGLIVLGSSLSIWAETGMGLVTVAPSGDQYNVNIKGNIRRIDVTNNVVSTTTGNIGYGICPRFSPDGNQFAFINGNRVTIANLDGGVATTFTVAGEGYLSWTNGGIWINAGGNLYKYSLTGQQLLVKSGFTCCENAFVSKNEITAGGVCPDGPYGGEQPYIYSLTRNTSLMVPKRHNNDPHAGCSVCPNPTGTLLTNNLNEYVNGVHLMHQTMRIIDTLAVEKYYLNLMTITGLSNNYYWNTQCWSGQSDEWLVLPIGRTNTSDNPCLNVSMEPWVYNITTHQAIRLATRTNDFWNPYDYYSGKNPGNTTPVLQLSPARLDFVAYVGDANPASKAITAFTSTGSLKGIKVSGVQPWISAIPASDTGVSVVITNTISIAGKPEGVYLDTITVETSNGGPNKTYLVSLTLQTRAIFTSIELTPTEATVASGSTYQFLAEPLDQTENYFPGTTITFSATGGTISQTGLFTPGSNLGGPYFVYVTAQAGSVTLRDTAKIVITRKEGFRKKINCGDNAYDVTGWERDDAYVTGGADLNNTGTITTTNVAGAAPNQVYKSVRRQSAHTYTFNGLKTGSYTIRLHWAEPTAATRRYMNYTVNGTLNIFRDFDIATRAGSINKALVLDRVAEIQDTTMQILCSGSNSSDVFESGIEIIRNYRDPLTLLAPLGGEKLSVGQSTIIRWCSDTLEIPSIDVELSVNNGRSWGFISPVTHISTAVPSGAWTHWTWTIPDSVMVGTVKQSCVSTACKLRISNYSHPGLFSYTDSAFAILPRDAAALKPAFPRLNHCGVSATFRGKKLFIAVASYGQHRVEIFSISGSLISARRGFGEATYSVPANEISVGTYFIRMKADGQVLEKAIVMR